jgi:tetratricopeptide (TPR) repeat protein
MSEGKYQDAASALEALANDNPDDALADDALFLAATLHEERLAQPGKARSLYRRLLDRYPDSRSALAARRRLDSLIAAIGEDGEGAEALAAFQSLLNRYSELGDQAALAESQRILREHSGWPERYRIRLWRGHLLRRIGRLDAAAEEFALAADEKSPPAARFEALISGAETEILRGRYDQARLLHQRASQLASGASAAEQEILEDLSERIDRSQGRSRTLLLAYAVAILCALVLLALSLWPRPKRWLQALKPPSEVLFLLPPSALLTVMALTSHREIGPAVALICAAGLGYSWLAGCAWRQRRPRLPTALIAATACAGIAAMCYIAVHRSQLLDLILTTVKFGPE